MSLRDRYAIAGVGTSRLGKVPGVSALGLITEAMRNCVEESGIDKNEIDGVICRGPDDVYGFHQRVAERLGINVNFSTTMDNGGASQILSVALAAMAIDAGLCNVVLCGYGRDAWSRTHVSEEVRVAGRAAEVARYEFAGEESGMFGAPAMHALGARRHMDRYGTTKEHFGAVSLAFREHALRNPVAQMKKPLTMEDYLGARPIVDPFNVLDCSLRSDAAGAMLVMSRERAAQLRLPPVLISGFGTFNNTSGWFVDDHMLTTAAAPSAQKAYAMAGIGPGEVDTFQVYDCFTYMAIVQLEDYGFCKKGEGGPLAASGALAIDGSIPTNTSGGQLSESHCEGVLQIVEAVRQLRHDYDDKRQVRGAEVAVVSGHGGNTVCHSSLVLRSAS
ncbi:MAG TPA: thiolase family protein [Acidimicrobiales bacterium]|nr:thiolase family protein [Acidimicrobiales bacterium]